MVHLPDEIWLKVAEYIDPPAQRCTCECEAGRERNKVVEQNLINLCLVSKQLRAVFQPLLYRSFVKFSRSCAHIRLLTSDSEWLHKYYQQDEKTFRTIRKATRLEKFLRTLIHRPDLAAMIKQLHIGWFVEDSSLPVHLRKLYDRLPLHDTLTSTFVSALRTFPGFERMCVQSRRSWLTALREGEEGAEVALLLILLPNLRFLHIESKTGDLGQYVQELHDILLGPGPTSWTIKSVGGMLVQHPVVEPQVRQPPQMLKALESLSVWSNGAGIRSLQSCVDLFSLPSLSLFEARGLDQIGGLQLEPGISFTSLQHLTLTHCKLRGYVIQALLTKCTRLESLVLDSEYAFNPNASPPSLDAGCLTALQSSASTLERLTLLMPEYEIESVLDVSSFEKLRFLELNQSFFSHSLGQAPLHKSLPTSIQHLIIRKTTIWIKPHLESFFDTFGQPPEFPDLTVLELYAEEDEYDELKRELIGFHTRAQQCGIDFEVEEEPEYNHWWYWMSDSDSEGDSENDADSDSEPDSDSVDFDHDDSDSEDSDAHYD